MTSADKWLTAIADAKVALETGRRIGLGVSVTPGTTTEIQMSTERDGRVEIWERHDNGRKLRTDFRDSALTGRLLKVALRIDEALTRQRPGGIAWNVSDPDVVDALSPLVELCETIGVLAEAIESLTHVTISKEMLELEVRRGEIPTSELVDALTRIGYRASTLAEADKTLTPMIDQVDARVEEITRFAVLRWAAANDRHQSVAVSTRTGAPVVEEARIRLYAARSRMTSTSPGL